MTIEQHIVNDITIAELISNAMIIDSIEDGINLLGNLYYNGFDRIIIYEENITPKFFDLQNGIAGEILQKFSNYRVRLAIVGDFTKFKSNSLHEFIYESNKGRLIHFVSTKLEAMKLLER
jgi:hypothetical protein